MSEALTVSVPEAGRMLGIGRSTAFKLVKEGQIPAIRLGKKLRVPKATLEKMLQAVDKPTSSGPGAN